MKIKNSTAGSFVASFMQASNRFTAGKEAGNELESAMFKKFKSMSAGSKEIMTRTAKTFKALPAKRKGKCVKDIMQDPNKPTSITTVAKGFAEELTSMVSGMALGNQATALVERPGKVRLIKFPAGGDDVYPNQVHIFKINDIRTNDYVPFLKAKDFLPEEYQQVCTPREVGNTVKWDCKIQRQPCDGHGIDNVCLRVLEVQSGTSVTLTGVNFFNLDAKIHIRKKGSSAGFKKLKAFVYGDITTPVYKTVNGTRKLINDKRVSDKIFFTIPPDTAPGIFEFFVFFPNNSGVTGHGIGDEFSSNIQYIEVIPPTTARFQIASESLWAKDETGTQDWTGSDEVGIKINAVPLFTDLTMGSMQQHQYRFGDVDSGETRAMETVLFSHSKSIAGVILSVVGYEIDDDDAYKNQIMEWTDIFIDLLKDQWELVIGSTAAVAALKELVGIGFYGYVILGCAILLTAAIDFIYSLWAAPDLIIQDTLAYSVSDLGKMTNINIPKPLANSDKTIYITAGGIDVRLMSNEKVPNEYTEQRGYLSDDNSWYNIKFRFNRLS
jgi:hypothetical protein